MDVHWEQSLASFPGHSHPPAFHCLQSANTVGEGMGDLVACNAIRYTDGRHTVLCPTKNVEVILVLTSEHNGEC